MKFMVKRKAKTSIFEEQIEYACTQTMQMYDLVEDITNSWKKLV